MMSDVPRDPAEPNEPGEDFDDDLDPNPEPDEPEPEDPVEEGEPEPEPEPEPAARQSRRERGRETGRQIREIAERTERLERENAELRARVTQPAVDPQALARAEQEFYASLEMMPHHQAIQAAVEYAGRKFAAQMGQQQLTTQETLDKQGYDAKAAGNPLYQRYQPRVEEMVARERARGNMVPRDAALKYLIGEDAISKAGRVVPAQRRAAAARVDAAQTRPGSPRGEGAGSRRPAAGSLEADVALIEQAIARGESVF